MNFRGPSFVAVALILAPSVQSKTVQATNDTFESVLATVQGGDTIDMIGEFQLLYTRDYSFSTPLLINASQATFNRTWTLRDVNNISITGGLFKFQPANPLYSSAIITYDGSNISFDRGVFIDDGFNTGLKFTGTSNVSVTNSRFDNLARSIVFQNVNGGLAYNNLTTDARIDGINIGGSNDILASHNSCIQGNPDPGVHPDCIQIFGQEGNPLPRNITVSDNLAFGETQGFTKFITGGAGTNITIIRNLVETTRSQGVACYDCYDSNISDNLLVTLAGASFVVNVNVIGGSNNIVSGNVFDRSYPVSPYRPAVGSIWHDAGVIPWGIGTVPEPSVWATLMIGFGAIGAVIRRRRGQPVIA